MQKATVLLLGLIILTGAIVRSRDKTKPSRFPHLKGWQKVFGILAVAATLLIILNPEFMAFGLFGDTAFFELLVLALSLQMHTFVVRAVRSGVDLVRRGGRWLGIPSFGLRYTLMIWTPMIAIAATAIRKAAQRILS